MTEAAAALQEFCTSDVPSRRAMLHRQLAAIAEREPRVRAFACLDAPAAFRTAAAALDAPEGLPLAGALVAVKDLICTEQFPTGWGSPFPAELGECRDAWCVGEVRRRGGTILGKTFANCFSHPVPTTNPRDPARTPGGSSAGSAAAVAAGFASFALGTQTAGSIARPASFCGVVGFKPSYGLLWTDGVQALSSTLDHLGVFAATARDAWYFVTSLVDQAEVIAPLRPERLLLLCIPDEIGLESGQASYMSELTDTLAAQGIAVNQIALPYPVEDFVRLQKTICYWEASRMLLASGRVRLNTPTDAVLRSYLALDVEHYLKAQRLRATYQASFNELAARFDAVLLPAAPGIAPASLDDTGDPIMNRFWTALHVPTVSVPRWRSSEGMPLGLQLVGTLGTDRKIIQVAQWFQDQLCDA